MDSAKLIRPFGYENERIPPFLSWNDSATLKDIFDGHGGRKKRL
jgi:hypothetical protein